MNLDFSLNIMNLYTLATILVSLAVFAYVVWIVQSRKHSLLVRIKDITGEKTKICKPNGDNTIQIQKKKRGKVAWKAKYSRNSLIRLSGMFNPPFAIDIFSNSPKAIDYEWELKSTDQPKWDKQTSQEFIDAEALKNRGRGLGNKTPLGIWIVAILVVVSLVLQFAQMRGIKIV